MGKLKSVHVRCEHCGKWSRPPFSFGDDESFNANPLIGSQVLCRQYRKWTGYNKENMRVRGEDDRFVRENT